MYWAKGRPTNSLNRYILAGKSQNQYLNSHDILNYITFIASDYSFIHYEADDGHDYTEHGQEDPVFSKLGEGVPPYVRRCFGKFTC